MALLIGVALLAGPASAGWWWPTQGTWVQTHHLTPDDADERGALGNPSHWGIHFGSAVAIDGDTLVAGTQYDPYGDSLNTPDGHGGDWIYVFERGTDGDWQQTAKLVPSDARSGDSFAWSLDLDSESGTVVAGNPAAEKIYIFERTEGGSWAETATFKPPKEATKIYGFYAYTVAVSGQTVVTAWHPNLYLYKKVDGEWRETGTLPGASYVDLRDETLVSSIWDPDARHREYAIYSRDESGWTQTARLDPASRFDDTAVGRTEETIGCTARLNEEASVLVIGACIDRRIYGIPTEHEVQVGDQAYASVDAGAIGSAWIYEPIDGEWVFSADLPNPDPMPGLGDLFGLSVDVSGERVVVGAPFDDENGGQNGDGAAYIYEKSGDGWSLTAKLRNHDSGPYGGKDVFGSSVGVSGETVIAGAPFDDQRRDGTPSPADDDGDIPPCIHRELFSHCDDGENAGSVYVFDRATSVPTPGGLSISR